MAARTASIAICTPPSVPFLKPTGIERPDVSSRCTWLSVVRAPIAPHETRSEVYWGEIGSRNSQPVGSPSSASSRRSRSSWPLRMLATSSRPRLTVMEACSLSGSSSSRIAGGRSGRRLSTRRSRVGLNTASKSTSDTPECRLRGEADPEALLDGSLHLPCEGQDVLRARPVVGDDGQGMAAGQADRPLAPAPLEAGVLDEPGGGELDAAVGLGPARHRGGEDPGLDLRTLGRGDDRVDEERSAAPPVLVGGVVEHHRLRAT